MSKEKLETGTHTADHSPRKVTRQDCICPETMLDTLCPWCAPNARGADHSRRAEMPQGDESTTSVRGYYDGWNDEEEHEEKPSTNQSQAPAASKGANQVWEVGSTVTHSATSKRSQDSREVVVGCADCSRPYGHEHGFPDLIVPFDVWRRITPTEGDGGLLCPSCICKRLHDAGISCEGAFLSGPIISVGATEMELLRRVENLELAKTRNNKWQASPESRPAPPPLEEK